MSVVVWAVLGLIPVAAAISAACTLVLVRVGHRMGTLDGAGVLGQVKAAARRVPNTGGVALFLAIAAPTAVLFAAGWLVSPNAWPSAVAVHVPGVRERLPLGLAFVGGLLVLHVLGLVDDRRPLAWRPKLAVTLAVPLVLGVFFETRLLTALDGVVGGSWASVAVTVLWFGAVTNAMNFMDNMDGLSAGTACVSGVAFLVAALLGGQWFVAAGLALVVGATGGFLVFNFPRFGARPASIFMGDGGSLVLGYCLAFWTTRTTYVGGASESVAGATVGSGAWYAVLMPLVVLAVPLYDLVTVSAVRLSQGRSPFVGDLQHFSHRLVRRGLSRRGAVLLIWALTGVTSISAVSLGRLEWWQAALVGVQTLLTLGVIALVERQTSSGA
ncbi:MAG: MraY family glycosyltransferase [Planctomycetota bacterium]